MIQPPRRSVTRFFIPLIDVLILLFGIFLLMPFVSRSDAGSAEGGGDGSTVSPTAVEDLRRQVTELQLKLEQARQELAALRREAANPANRMSVRVLEIDDATGRLYSFDPDSPEPRQEIRDQADAQRLIDQQKRVAQGKKEVFFLILYPRKLTGFPLQDQIDTYRRWFKDVPHGFDNPWTASVRP